MVIALIMVLGIDHGRGSHSVRFSYLPFSVGVPEKCS